MGFWLWVPDEARPAKPSRQKLANIFVVDAEKEFPDVTPLPGILPGEFERHDALLIGWPDRTLQDPSQELVALNNNLNHSILEVISHAQAQMQVVVVVPSSSHRQSVLAQLNEAKIPTERVDVAITHIDTRWVRDFGPHCLRPNRPGELIWVASQFYCEVGARTLDEQMAKRFSIQQNISPFEAALFLDGAIFIPTAKDWSSPRRKLSR
jgi:agmatine/peptidylarginine deiminase